MKWLTWGGAAAALLVAGATVWGVGWRGLWLLLAFFVSASLLTRGGGRRNARQVVANGGIAAAAALLGAWPACAGALAAAAADTWATEIGTRSPTPPRLITSGAQVPRGASGGITALGTGSGVAGAALMAGVATHPGWGTVVIAAAGVLGMLVDSLLGATAQALFECPSCGARSERREMVCHEPVRLIRGYAWLDNDAVNLAATLAGAGIAAAGWRLCC